MRKQFLILLLSCLLSVGCHPPFVNNIQQEKVLSSIQPDGAFHVYSPVWLSDTEILFSFAPATDLTGAEVIIPDIRLFQTDSQKWEKVPVVNSAGCRILSFKFLQRLPNHHLGFYNTCLSDKGSTRSVIQEMNISTGQVKTLVEADLNISAGQFSFSPDMSEMIQEDMTGRFLSNKLFYKHDDSSSQLFPSFTRAMYPSWSPLERTIAFWGTENYPGGKPEDFKTEKEISGLALYPFDLYISSPEGTNLNKVVSSVQDPLLIKWSPKGRTIAFAGTIDNYSGIWLVNPSTSEVIHIWSSSADFDWSPDGSKIVIVSNRKDEAGKITKQEINIIYVPS